MAQISCLPWLGTERQRRLTGSCDSAAVLWSCERVHVLVLLPMHAAQVATINTFSSYHLTAHVVVVTFSGFD